MSSDERRVVWIDGEGSSFFSIDYNEKEERYSVAVADDSSAPATGMDMTRDQLWEVFDKLVDELKPLIC